MLEKSVRKYILYNPTHPTQKIKSLETIRFQSFLIGADNRGRTCTGLPPDPKSDFHCITACLQCYVSTLNPLHINGSGLLVLIPLKIKNTKFLQSVRQMLDSLLYRCFNYIAEWSKGNLLSRGTHERKEDVSFFAHALLCF